MLEDTAAMERYLPTIRAVLALATRIGLGVVFIAHGWQKLGTDGVDTVAAGFAHSGIPAPTVAAWYATIVELVGGVLLIAGLALPVVGVLLFLDMGGAFLFVHAGHGLFSAAGGFELVLVLGLASLLVGFAGGPLSLDRLVVRRRSRPGRTDDAVQATG